MTNRQRKAQERRAALQALKRDSLDVKNALQRLESKVRELSSKEADQLWRIMLRFEHWRSL